MKKRILIYGDSNTWGAIGSGGGRYQQSEQWPNILQNLLGDEYEILQEGLPGRIAGNHDTADIHRNGRNGYEIALRVAAPVSFVIIALGTNDAKKKYNLTVSQIVDDLVWYGVRTGMYASQHPQEMSTYQKTLYLGVANFGVNDYFETTETYPDDVNNELRIRGETVISPGNLKHGEDGLHYALDDHRQVAEQVLEKLKETNDEV